MYFYVGSALRFIVLYYSVQCFMFKYHHDKLPKVFDKFFVRNSDIHERDTKSRPLFHVPLCHCEARCISIYISGVKCYNYLYDKLALSTSLYQYKMNLKIFLRESDITKVLNSPK